MKKMQGVEILDDAGTVNETTANREQATPDVLLRPPPALYRTAVRRVGDAEDAADDRLASLPTCKGAEKRYASIFRRVSRRSKVLPQALRDLARIDLKLLATRGRTAKMGLALQVISSHLLAALDIASALATQPRLIDRLLPHAASEADALKRADSPRLFLLDSCSLTVPLGPLSSRLRASSPGSKFLALLSPDRSSEAEMISLFHWGIDGMLVLDKNWQAELPKAVAALLGNRVWVPSEVLLAFVRQMKLLLDRQLVPGQSLTAREGQVLQLLFRRLTNKEIAGDLRISERTAKFHVCNVLNKLGLENRRNLLETFGLKMI